MGSWRSDSPAAGGCRAAGHYVSYFGDSITPVDEKGEALYGMIPGFCGRSFKEVQTIGREIGADTYAKITGNTLSTLATPSKIMWLRDNEPEVFKKRLASTPISSM